MFISFMRRDQRNYKEKNEYKKDFEDERNDRGEIYALCFVCESIGNKLSCR